VITACGPGCGFCGMCSDEWEREGSLTCDHCGGEAVEVDVHGATDRLCVTCEEERDEARRDDAVDRKRDEQFFDRR
jgi:hypothetical protein